MTNGSMQNVPSLNFNRVEVLPLIVSLLRLCKTYPCHANNMKDTPLNGIAS